MVNVNEDYLAGLLPGRKDRTTKRDYGHLLLVCGCRTMPGAALLSCGAALKSGCGLVTLHTVENAAAAAMVSCPSAMLSIENGDCFSNPPSDLGRYSAVGVGPGLGRAGDTVDALAELLGAAHEEDIPMLLDADALNIISGHSELRSLIPEGSVLTPHQGELRRMLSWKTDEEKDPVIWDFCSRHSCTLVSKGFHTEIYSSAAEKYVNPTGNAGMAKGGSGDVLAGLVSGLMARGLAGLDAALLGVWIHGYAGDRLSERCTEEAYSSKDLIDVLYKGFARLREIKRESGPK